MKDPGELLLWILAWLFYQLVQALFINGLFISAKGRTDKMPDGTLAHSEMILYPLYRFLNQTKIFKIHIGKDKLEGKVPESIWISWTNFVKGKGYPICSENELTRCNVFDSIRAWAIGKGWEADFEGHVQWITIYKAEEDYRFSKYFRKPIITCVICMASFWSIFTFIIPVIYIWGFSFQVAALCLANIVSLSYVNYLIFKPRK